MPLTTEQRDFLKKAYQYLSDEAIGPDDPRYQPVYQLPGIEDPAELMYEHIEYAGPESVQMFSGFRGSGKTTELFRLKKHLEDQGYVVLYGDAQAYLNLSGPIDISDLLIVLAGAFSDALERELKIDIGGESYWTRLVNYLMETNVEVKEIGIKTEAAGPLAWLGGIKTGADLKLALSTTPSFREKLQQRLANHLGELKNQLNHFIEDGIKAIRKARGENARVVFLFDSLEQIRGSLSNELAVIRSVETLFANHLKKLDLPYVHVVYTVPPWLQFVMPNMASITLLPSIKQWENDDVRTSYEPGCEALRALVRKRFGDDGFTEFFGQPNKADHLIGVCGGHFRDLLMLLRETVVRAKSLPVSDLAIRRAIQKVRGNFLPIAIEDAIWLDQIEKLRTTALPSNKPEDAGRLTRFLDTHFVLYLTNGEEWYDIHPLIRGEVAKIVKRHEEITQEET